MHILSEDDWKNKGFKADSRLVLWSCDITNQLYENIKS